MIEGNVSFLALLCVLCKASPAVVHDQTVVYVDPGRHCSRKCGWIFGLNEGPQGLQQAALLVGQACDMQGTTQAQHGEAWSSNCKRRHDTVCLKQQAHGRVSAVAPGAMRAAHV